MQLSTFQSVIDMPGPTLVAPDDAPVDIRLDATEQLVVEALVLVAAVAAVIWFLRRGRQPLSTTISVLVGAALTTLTAEAALDRLGGVSWAIRGDTPHTVVRLFGASIPFWMVVVYVLVVGVGSMHVVQRLDEGATARDLLSIYGFWVVADLVLEHGLLHLTSLYRYWGDHQPLFDADWWRQPLWFTATTASAPLLVAGLVLVSREMDRRLRPWILVVLVPTGFFAWYLLCTAPAVTAVNSDVSRPVAHLLGVASVVLTVLFVRELLCRQLPRIAAAQALRSTGERVPA
jgi:hypothetical protein